MYGGRKHAEPVAEMINSNNRLFHHRPTGEVWGTNRMDRCTEHFKGKEFRLDMRTVIRKYESDWIIVESE